MTRQPPHLVVKGVRASGAALALLAAATGLGAAPSPAPATAPYGADDTLAAARLPKVTVAAQKEPADAQQIPVSVTAITATTLQDADINWVKDASVYAPNVFLNEFSARKLSNPYVRGIGGSPNNPGVTTYIDGVPQLNANSSSLELIDVEQLEFVRGPQGALFGRNTVGGLINITSRRPSTAWGVQTAGTYGNYDYREARARLSGPLMEGRAGLSLAGGYSARDGFTINDATGHRLDGREAGFGKAQLLWTPSENWEARLIVSAETAADGDYGLGDLWAQRARPHHVAHDFEGSTGRDIVAPTLLLSYRDPALELTLTSGLVWWQTRDVTDLDASLAPAVTRDNREKDLQFTEEIRLASAKDAPLNLAEKLKLKWQTGVSFFTQNYQQDAVNSYAPGVLYQAGQFGPGFPPFSSAANAQLAPESRLDDIGVGAFAQATFMAWEKLDLSLGVHGDYESKTADLNTFFANADPLLGPATRLKPDQDFREVSPQAALAYHFTPEKTAYATIGRGYKAGGFNPMSPLGAQAYGQESSWNYEVGARSSWCDGRYAANLALFYVHWDDLQLNLPTGAPGQYYIANAGSAASKGAELELRARPLVGWDVFGGVGYTDARFLSGASAGHTDAFGTASRADVTGRRLIYTPDFTANGGMQYSRPLHARATLYARAEAVVYGRFYYNPLNTASQSTYSLADFRLGVRGRCWFAEGWVRNAFDTHYVPVAFEFPNGASGFLAESGAPVTFGLRGGLCF